MKSLKFVGNRATRKEVSKEDFMANGVDDQDAVVWDIADANTGGVTEVSDSAADMLMRLEPANWEEVAPEEQTSAPEGRPDENPSTPTIEDDGSEAGPVSTNPPGTPTTPGEPV